MGMIGYTNAFREKVLTIIVVFCTMLFANSALTYTHTLTYIHRMVTTSNNATLHQIIYLVVKVTQEAKDRMSFLERYEGFCVDLIKALSQEVTIINQAPILQY